MPYGTSKPRVPHWHAQEDETISKTECASLSRTSSNTKLAVANTMFADLFFVRVKYGRDKTQINCFEAPFFLITTDNLPWQGFAAGIFCKRNCLNFWKSMLPLRLWSPKCMSDAR